MSRWPSMPIGIRSLLLAIGAMAALLSLTCGGGEQATPTRTAPTATKVAPAATAAPTIAPTVAPPAAAKPSGELVAALESVGEPIGTPELCLPGCANEMYFFSIQETLTHWTADKKVEPGIADWELAPDLSKFTWKIFPGIPFHKGWGELTAEDVAWTLNTVNSVTNPDSIHDLAGEVSCCYGKTVAIDKYTADMPITNYDSRAPAWLFSNLRDSTGISSKAVFDKYGKEGMRDVIIGTGPYQVVEWTNDTRLILEAVENHHRKTGAVKTVRILEVPEEASRIAMFEAGEVIITHVSLPNTKRLVEAGGVARELETVITHLSLGVGNFLEKINPKTGEPLDNPGFDPSLPWVGDPDAPGCDYNMLLTVTPEVPVCDEMENARKVRTAMSMAIDREALVKGLYQDLAWPAGDWAISSKHPLYKDEWNMKFDPARARELLKEAGYEGGFKADMWPGTEVTEQAQVVASMWEENLGITTEFHTAPWSAMVDKFVGRSIKWLLFDGEQGGMPIDFAKGREAQAWFAGGIMWSGGIPFFQKIYGEMMKETDKAIRTKEALQFGDHERYWNWDPGLFERPIYTIYKGDAMEWRLTSESMHTQVSNYVFPLEDITLKQ